MSVLENTTETVAEAEEKVEAGLDHVAWVTETLRELGHTEPARWEQMLGNITMAEYDEFADGFVKRMEVNRALRNLLGNLEINTFETRMLIRDDLGDEDWQKLLKEGVLPFIAENNF